MPYEEREIRIRDIVALFKDQWKIIVIPAVLVGLCVSLYAKMSQKTQVSYSSSSMIRIGGTLTRPLETIGNISAIMTSLPMRSEIARAANVPGEGASERIANAVSYQDDAGFLRITATAATPDEAVKLVSAATAIVMKRHDDLFARTKSEIDSQIEYIQKNVRALTISATSIIEFRLMRSIVEIAPVYDKTPIIVVQKGKNIFPLIPLTFFLGVAGGVVRQYRKSKGKQGSA